MSKETLVVAGALALLLFVLFWTLPFDMYFAVLSAIATLLFFGALFATDTERNARKNSA